MTPIAIATAIAAPVLMTGDQQFYLGIAAIVGNAIAVVAMMRKQDATHKLVNSELSEFKRLLAENAAKGVSDARLQGVREGREIQHTGPAGPQGDVGPVGPKGSA